MAAPQQRDWPALTGQRMTERVLQFFDLVKARTGMSQSAFGKRIGSGYMTVDQWRQNPDRVISPKSLARLEALASELGAPYVQRDFIVGTLQEQSWLGTANEIESPAEEADGSAMPPEHARVFIGELDYEHPVKRALLRFIERFPERTWTERQIEESAELLKLGASEYDVYDRAKRGRAENEVRRFEHPVDLTRAKVPPQNGARPRGRKRTRPKRPRLKRPSGT